MQLTSDTPIFRQIADRLKARIAAGDLPPHDALPSERVVAEHEQVSRMTARRALETLEAEGLAYSKGRTGRFISPPRIDYNLASMSDFVAKAAKTGVEIDITLQSSRLTTANRAHATSLSICTNTPIFENHRLFRHQGHAIFLETEYVVVDRCEEQVTNWPSLTPEERQNLRYSPLGHTADIVIKMRPFSSSQAALLEVNPNQMGIAQEQVVRDKVGRPLCLSIQIWRGELAQFTARALLSEYR
ncbi:GntR family transcriptional regulator [Litoreibacter sp.]|nr:GntR family transcriptional regulator [Litoreibacter sp.]